MPIVPPTSDREQQIGQDAAENERNSNQELQNRIHHGFLPGINQMLKLDNVENHTLITLACDAYDPVPVIYASDNGGTWRSDFATVLAHCGRAEAPGERLTEALAPAMAIHSKV